jgi:hypothetical protein
MLWMLQDIPEVLIRHLDHPPVTTTITIHHPWPRPY